MKRLRRWMLNALAVLSLLLCIATVALWARSEHQLDCFIRNISPGLPSDSQPAYLLFTGPGVVDLAKEDPAQWNNIEWDGPELQFWSGPRSSPPIVSPDGKMTIYLDAPPWKPPTHEFAGFGWEGSAVAMGPNLTPTTWRISLPLWFFALALSVFPLSRIVSMTGHVRRRRAGFCAGCGYDLRATPDRCPECGTEAGKVRS
jgi:hypothetical protein